MQLVSSTLLASATMMNNQPLNRDQLPAASEWVALRLSRRIESEYFLPGAKHSNLLSQLIMAVQMALDYLLCQHLEVPYIYSHRRDYISHFDPSLTRSTVELLKRDELWKVYTLGQKYRALVDRRAAIEEAYSKLGVSDEYFTNDIRPAMDSIEVIADATEWLGMKYKDQKSDAATLHFHDDIEERKIKMPSRVSAYEIAKKTPVAKLARDFGLSSQSVVRNLTRKSYFPEDPELPPLIYAEQFSEMPELHGLSVEETLKRARMIIATELGRDPILRKKIRLLFKTEALISVLPTEKGLTKIDDHHKYYVRVARCLTSEWLRSLVFLRTLNI